MNDLGYEKELHEWYLSVQFSPKYFPLKGFWTEKGESEILNPFFHPSISSTKP